MAGQYAKYVPYGIVQMASPADTRNPKALGEYGAYTKC